jgi:hypothetical protein
MKFYAEPNLLVRVNKNIPSNRRMKAFRFDENGIFETENIRLIALLKKRFKFEEVTKQEEIKEEIIEEVTEEKKVYSCKHCNYETNNKGELLAHYRTHKK